MGTDAQADDLSGLTGFFFYVFIIHPCTAWILRPGRFERKRSIMYAISFLAVVATVKSFYEMQARGPNYYSQLGVTRASNPLEIKRAYKKLSLQLHPDKNPSPDAADQFDAVKQAYDVLMDMELREVYNKFGKEGVDQNKRYNETQFLIETAVFYVTWGMLAFLLTMGKRAGDARNWTFTGLVAMLVVEVALISSHSNPVPTWLAPTITEFEIVWLMHSLFPAFMNGCRSLGAYLYVDVEAQTRQLLVALQEQSKDILLVLRDVQIAVHNVRTGAGAGAQPGTSSQPIGGASSLPRATPTGKIKELQDRLQTSNTNVAAAVKSLKEESSRSSTMGFYLMILGYIVISYMFS
mmetsp:Transcript_48939/g.73039  ORF Transcript_48939/g.73039 Transcript_48939/m.73039 type:complete len:351 (-) Transcript_48939:217-1269(-)|eukprot:CAMPEP_0194048252 /NCGR_PEP_ID=MMETSP0009_2-20130614/26810_1 /TAXON_ID=210454 /ORGANISM="Grammatophora oceanica, Strain CCMP 410" /LENGTH=350 /DNA_ID=CAMNT_0038694075 /DNA_START=160 /DNA_END=1212 /DNA_ORIENTATION=+